MRQAPHGYRSPCRAVEGDPLPLYVYDNSQAKAVFLPPLSSRTHTRTWMGKQEQTHTHTLAQPQQAHFASKTHSQWPGHKSQQPSSHTQPAIKHRGGLTPLSATKPANAQYGAIWRSKTSLSPSFVLRLRTVPDIALTLAHSAPRPRADEVEALMPPRPQSCPPHPCTSAAASPAAPAWHPSSLWNLAQEGGGQFRGGG